MNDQQPKHVFISYVRENQEQVDRLCQDLEGQGVKVWLDRTSIKPGARWKDAIRKAIRQGNFFIACFSKEYTSKGKTHMNEELVLATEELRQYPPDREWFIPVLLSECDVPARSIGAGETLLDINWVPLYEDWKDGIERILTVIKPIPPEIQNLISALHSDDRDVRLKAIEALCKIADPSPLSAIIEIQSDTNKNFLYNASEALRKMHHEVKVALIEALRDEDEGVRQSAALVMEKIGPGAVPALIEALKDKDEDVCRRAAQTLENIGPGAKAALPALIEALKDEDKIVRWRTIRILGKIGLEAIPALTEALKNDDKKVRFQAVGALGEIDLKAETAVSFLVEALKDVDGGVRWLAARSLRNIGSDAKSAVPALKKALKDNWQAVRHYALQALEKLNTPEARKVLEDYKHESD